MLWVLFSGYIGLKTKLFWLVPAGVYLVLLTFQRTLCKAVTYARVECSVKWLEFLTHWEAYSLEFILILLLYVILGIAALIKRDKWLLVAAVEGLSISFLCRPAFGEW